MTDTVFSSMCQGLAYLSNAIHLANLDANDAEIVIRLKGRASPAMMNAAILRDVSPLTSRMTSDPTLGGQLMGFKLTLEETK